MAAPTAPLQRQLRLAALPLLFLTSCRSEPIVGPFRVVIEEVTACPAEMLDVPFHFNIAAARSPNSLDQWSLSGNLTFPAQISDASDAYFRMAAWHRGTWMENAQSFVFRKLCSSLKGAFPQIFHNLMVVAHNGEEGKECPIAPGTYAGTKVTADLSSPAIKTFFYGRWRLDARAVEAKTKRSVACFRSVIRIVPRRSTAG